jgi:glucose-1-phosphate thymidylyltransferase
MELAKKKEITKGVILCGGKGTRLYPLTKVTNKHLLAVGNVPMIYHPIKTLVDAGIKEILIVSGTEHVGDFVKTLGSGKELGISLTYRVQDTAGGIAQALSLAEKFVGNDTFVTILGDNIFGYMGNKIQSLGQKAHCGLFLSYSKTPSRFGVVTLSKDECSITEINEKPSFPKSKWVVTGLYIYTPSVFDVIRTIAPSGRGELEITDVNNHYVKRCCVKHKIVNCFWSDAGTFESLKQVNEHFRDDEMPC